MRPPSRREPRRRPCARRCYHPTRRSARGRARSGALPAPAAADAPRVRTRAEGLRPAGATVLARAGRPRHVGRRSRPPRREPRRSRRRSPRADGPERPAVVARRRPLHRAEDRAGQRPADDPAALHRHADRGLQRRVEPGAAPGGEPARVRQGLDADRRGAGLRPARPAGRPGSRRHDPRPERGVRPRGDPLARGAVLDRLDEGRAGRGRGGAARDPRRAPSPAGPRLPHGALRPGDALDLPRLPGERDRGDGRLPDGGGGTPRHGKAEPHAPRKGSGGRAPPRRARLHGRRDPDGGLRPRPAVGPGARDDRPARRAVARTRSRVPPQALEHAGGAQPPRVLPARRGRDVPLGGAAPRDHPGPRGALPPRAAGGAALLLRGCRQPQLPGLRGPRPGAGHRLLRPAQAGRATPACRSTSRTSRSACGLSACARSGTSW